MTNFHSPKQKIDSLGPDQKVKEAKRGRLIVQARLHEAEYWEFMKCARERGITPSRFMRLCLREVMGQGPDLYGEEFTLLSKIFVHLGAVGRNLNQLVRSLNSHQAVGDRELKETVSAVHQETKKVSEVLGDLLHHAQQRRIRGE